MQCHSHQKNPDLVYVVAAGSFVTMAVSVVTLFKQTVYGKNWDFVCKMFEGCLIHYRVSSLFAPCTKPGSMLGK